MNLIMEDDEAMAISRLISHESYCTFMSGNKNIMRLIFDRDKLNNKIILYDVCHSKAGNLYSEYETLRTETATLDSFVFPIYGSEWFAVKLLNDLGKVDDMYPTGRPFEFMQEVIRYTLLGYTIVGFDKSNYSSFSGNLDTIEHAGKAILANTLKVKYRNNKISINTELDTRHCKYYLSDEDIEVSNKSFRILAGFPAILPKK